MVRDIAQEKNKEIELEIRGSETSTDKKIIEEIKSPLIHIIRNAIDHGIETPEERMALGKNPVGKIVIRASQVFEGVVIRTDRKESHTARITVRKIASGVGVEKSFLLHSPLVEKIEIVRRSKVRRNYLSFLRNRSGKSARLKQVAFDREAVNTLPEAPKAEEKVEEVAETPAEA
jgi:ribosomal protein L19